MNALGGQEVQSENGISRSIFLGLIEIATAPLLMPPHDAPGEDLGSLCGPLGVGEAVGG